MRKKLHTVTCLPPVGGATQIGQNVPNQRLFVVNAFHAATWELLGGPLSFSMTQSIVSAKDVLLQHPLCVEE